MKPVREISCTEVWGGTGATEVSVKLAGVRGECYSRPFGGQDHGGDIHFLSVCGMSILSKVVLADVSGHGGESAAVSAIIHDALIENIGAHDNSTMLARVNEAFLESRAGKPNFRFTTMVSLIIDNRDRSMVYAYAGHPSILLGSKRTGRFTGIKPASGPRGGIPLGVLPGTQYEQHAVDLDAGDVLVVHTDAFTEARTDAGALLGEEGFARMLEAAGSLRPDELKDFVLARLDGRLDDDASIVILEVL